MSDYDDKIVYLVCTYGVDGRDKEVIEFASFDPKERDEWYDHIEVSNKPYYSKVKRIIDVNHETTQAYAKLSGLQRLLLGLVQKVPQ